MIKKNNMPTMEPAQNEWLDIYRIGHCQLFPLDSD